MTVAKTSPVPLSSHPPCSTVPLSSHPPVLLQLSVEKHRLSLPLLIPHSWYPPPCSRVTTEGQWTLNRACPSQPVPHLPKDGVDRCHRWGLKSEGSSLSFMGLEQLSEGKQVQCLDTQDKWIISVCLRMSVCVPVCKCVCLCVCSLEAW